LHNRKLIIVRALRKCDACGHYGHTPGPRCPLRNLVAQDRSLLRAREEASRMFPDKPQLRALLESMQASWAAKLRFTRFAAPAAPGLRAAGQRVGIDAPRARRSNARSGLT
jgi:hypothetical protein